MSAQSSTTTDGRVEKSKRNGKSIQNIKEVIKRWALNGKNKDNWKVKILEDNMEVKCVDTKCRPVLQLEPGAGSQEDAEARVTVHTSSFCNNTSVKIQKHHLKITRKCKKTSSWSMTKGHCFSYSVDLSVAPPEANLAAKFGLCHSEDESANESNTTEEERTNVIDSDIQVPKGKRVNVKLNITEENCIDEYKATYHIKGKVRAEIFKEGSKSKTLDGEAHDVFRGMEGFRLLPKTETDEAYAEFVNEGTYTRRGEIKQELELSEESL